MADNLVRKNVKTLSLACSSPATPASGDPVRYGFLTGVALNDEAGAPYSITGKTSVDLSTAIYNLSVKAIDNNGNSAVAAGDTIFYVDADTPKLSKKTSGYFFGFAMEIVTIGATATIQVLHVQSPGSGSLGSGDVGTSHLAANAVTAAKLTTTLATGYIPLDIFNARLVTTNELAAAVGASTDPILSRDNVATDKAGRLSWASTSVLEIQLPTIVSPPDLDDGAVITVKILAKMKAASVDTPVIAVGAWEGVGGSNVGGNTAALSTTLQTLSVDVAAGNVSAAPKAWAITLKPGTHATASNDVYVYGAWLEYTRK